MKDKVEIVYEDEFFLALDKPSGLVVHPDGRTEEETLVGFLENSSKERGLHDLENIGNPHTLDSGRYFKRWGIVNRLDRDTSGLVLVAKDDKTFSELQRQFMQREVTKEYMALVWGKVELVNNQVVVTAPISRHKKDPRIWVCGKGVGERQTTRDAETSVELDKHLGEGEVRKSLLRLYPKTGRTHQLRLHCRFLGHPIVGDTKYGINGISNEHSTEQIKQLLEKVSEEDIKEDQLLKLKLQAFSLQFKHPQNQNTIQIFSKLSLF